MDGHGQHQFKGKLWRLDNAQFVCSGPNFLKKTLPALINTNHQPKPEQNEG